MEAAFEAAALALTAVVTEPSRVNPSVCIEVSCEADDPEILLVDWLNAIVYEMATRRMLFSRFEVHIEDGELSGRMWGETADVARHEPAVEVKGATYTCLEVQQLAGGEWQVQCVVDV